MKLPSEILDYRIHTKSEEPLHRTEPSEFVSDFEVTLLTQEHEQRCGIALVHRIYVEEAMANEEGLFDVMDAHSETLLQFAKTISSDKQVWLKDSIIKTFGQTFPADILVVDRFILSPEVRGQKLGWFLMRKIIRSLGVGCGLVLCQPHPIVDDSERFFPKAWMADTAQLTQSKLRKYWSGCGFNRIGRSDIFAFSLTQPSDCFLAQPPFYYDGLQAL